MIRPTETAWLLAAACTAFSWAAAQDPRPGPVRTLFLEILSGTDAGAKPVEVPIEVGDPAFEKTLSQAVAMPEGCPSVRIVRYLPAAVLSQDVRPETGPEARPAMLLGVDGPKQSYRRWLVAGDPKHHRLISLIGTWSMISVADREARDAAFAVFGNPALGEPWLVVRRPGAAAPARFPARPGSATPADWNGAAVRVLEYLPHFSMGEDNKPVNLSDRPVNPAARVRIGPEGGGAERWVFTRMPGYGKDPADPVDVALECPLASDGPSTDFCLVAGPGTITEIWSRGGGGVRAEAVEIDRKIPIPNSRYTFQVARIEPAGRLVEGWAPIGGGLDATSVVQVEWTPADGAPATAWLPLGVPQEIPAAAGPLRLTFRRKLPDLPAGHPGEHR